MNRRNPRAATFGQPIANWTMKRRARRRRWRATEQARRKLVRRKVVWLTIDVDTSRFVDRLRRITERIDATCNALRAMGISAADAADNLRAAAATGPSLADYLDQKDAL